MFRHDSATDERIQLSGPDTLVSNSGIEFEYEELETGTYGNIDEQTTSKRWEPITAFLNRRF